MALTLTRAAENVTAVFGGAFVSADGGTTYTDLGIVRALKMTAEPVSTDADAYGRPHQISSRFVIEGTLMQTTNAELGEDGELAEAQYRLKLTTVATDAAGAGAADGYTFANAFLQMGSEINLGGEQSFRTFRVEGMVSRDHLAQFATTAVLTFGK